MPAISGLYCRNPVRYCHAELGVRTLDVACGKMALSAARLAAFAGGKFRPVGKYVQGTAKAVSFFGAGYCYIEVVVPEVRVRVARILGPCCLIIDVLRMMRVVGASQVRTYRLVELGGGAWHYEAISEVLVPAWVLAQELAEIVEIAVDARIGGRMSQDDLRALVRSGEVSRADLEELLGEEPATIPDVVEVVGNQAFGDVFGGLPLCGFPVLGAPVRSRPHGELVEWLRSRGWDPPGSALGLLYLLSTPPMEQSIVCAGGRARIKGWALYGDAVLRMAAISHALTLSLTPEQCSANLRLADNVNLANISDRIGLTVCLFGENGASCKVIADTFEALIGMVAAFAGVGVAVNVMVREVYSGFI